MRKSFQDLVLEQGDNAMKAKDFLTAHKYYQCYLNIKLARVDFPTRNFNFNFVPILFKYGECLLEEAKEDNNIHRFFINEIIDLSIYFDSVKKTYDEDLYEDILPLRQYLSHFHLLGQLYTSIKYFSSALDIYNEGYEESLRKEKNIQIQLDFLRKKVEVLEKQLKYKKVITEIKKCLSIIDKGLNSTEDEEEIEILKDFKEKHIQKMKNNQLERSLKRATSRDENAPLTITYKDHIFKYAYSTKEKYVYYCKFGINRHKTNKIKCQAKISVPKISIDIMTQEYQINIINDEHICDHEKSCVKKVILDAQLKETVENLYNDNPRPTRTQLINKIYQKIKDDTKDGDDIQTFSETLANSYYSNLEKMNKRTDPNFTEVIQTKRNTSLELFKHRFSKSHLKNQQSYIICYSSEFQRNCINESNFIFIDGTFDVCPSNFAQVLVIMGQTTNMNIPIAYFLLPDKTYETYNTAFSIFKIHLKTQFRRGVIFVTDFEKAEIKSVKQNFMNNNSYLQLCYFHFTQSMSRHFHKYVKTNFVKKLNHIANMLPFISEKRVNEVINQLYQYEETQIFAEYFDKNYLREYDYDDWCVYTKPQNQTITNNIVESHNNVLRQMIGPKPSLSKFEEKISELESQYHNKYRYRTQEQTDVKRIDEDDFNEYYRTFISELIRSKQNIQIRNTDSDANLLQSDTDTEELTSEDGLFDSSIEDFPDINKDDEKSEKVTNYNIQDQDNFERNKPEKENSSQGIIFKKLSSNGQEILLSKLKDYILAPQRSKEKRSILMEVSKELIDLGFHYSIDQIRSWFNNNKDKA